MRGKRLLQGCGGEDRKKGASTPDPARLQHPADWVSFCADFLSGEDGPPWRGWRGVNRQQPSFSVLVEDAACGFEGWFDAHEGSEGDGDVGGVCGLEESA